jgi:hypothetical protein
VLIAEQKLAVEVAEVDGVKVDDVDFAKPGEHDVFEQLAAYAASSHHEHARLSPVSDSSVLLLVSQSHLLDHAVQGTAEALLSKLVACHCGREGGSASVV